MMSYLRKVTLNFIKNIVIVNERDKQKQLNKS